MGRFISELPSTFAPDIRQHPLLTGIVCLCVTGILLCGKNAMAEPGKSLFRFGFSKSMFLDVNENDALAAVKVWATAMIKERNFPADPTPHVYSGVQEMKQALTVDQVDCLSLTAVEYAKLRSYLDLDVFLVGTNEGNISEEYLVLVHRDSGIEKVDELQGRRLFVYQNHRMALAPIWLDTALMEANLSPAAESCRVTSTTKLANAALPVFFRQADACVVSRNSFKALCELNPQLSQHLKVIAASPELVPGGLCFRRNANHKARERIITELTQFLSSAAGTQFMTLFQFNKVKVQRPSCMDSAMNLIAKHEQLLGRVKTASWQKP